MTRECCVPAAGIDDPAAGADRERPGPARDASFPLLDFLNPIPAMSERNRYRLDRTDRELFDAIQKESRRQEDHIALIADVLENPRDAAAIERVRVHVVEPTRRFPMYS
ncbi:hypothetical protein [Burkholderia lata]|uniref:Serine hydroxymethyltransferase n=1 Tax=Burkholderia lata (strain ATCC 17760 / DSM 23089 / LMG 22485 / NCIMB 9086 / R18194 / 383) TaxID=482957 RepID=A0A6P2ZBU4_BURL3|nr:hypothetical protein [Burkholderia lata]VWD32072.1 serine hydroxymethyltransferase [Burkholderia lata]